MAREFATKLHGGDILCFYGDLGAGKTTFIQGLAQGLGIEKRVNSPTFIILRSYDIPDRELQAFYHVDLYRLETEREILLTGLMDAMQEKNAITAIEWPERMGSLLPANRWEIHLEPIGESERKIHIERKNA